MLGLNQKLAAASLLLALPAVAAAAPAQQDEYTMHLSPSAATVAAGTTTATLITFDAPQYLRSTRAQLSVTGLPSGVSAAFYPPAPRLAAGSVLVLNTASSSPAGLSAVTITAITLSSDPIGTSTTFDLTVR
jgi:hypothetical protein